MWMDDNGHGNVRLSMLGTLGESAVCNSDWGTGQCRVVSVHWSLLEQGLSRGCLIREHGASLDKEDENQSLYTWGN